MFNYEIRMGHISHYGDEWTKVSRRYFSKDKARQVRDSLASFHYGSADIPVFAVFDVRDGSEVL